MKGAGADPQERVGLIPKLTSDVEDIRTKGHEPGRERVTEHVRRDATWRFAVAVGLLATASMPRAAFR